MVSGKLPVSNSWWNYWHGWKCIKVNYRQNLLLSCNYWKHSHRSSIITFPATPSFHNSISKENRQYSLSLNKDNLKLYLGNTLRLPCVK